MKPFLATLAAAIAFALAASASALAGGGPVSPPLLQSWSDRELISSDDDWRAVPALVGHRGDGLTAAAGADPRTITADGGATPLDVSANQTDPGSVGLAAGVAEFELDDPVVALQGSATAAAPHLLLSLDTRGRAGIGVRLLLRDIDASSIADAVQAVAVQYRVDAEGEFSTLPDGFVADATSGPSQATLVTPVRVALPPAADDRALVQVRVITTNATGQDEWVGVDDIEATASSAPGSGCPAGPVPVPPAPMPTPPGPIPPAPPGPSSPPPPPPAPSPGGVDVALLSELEIVPDTFPAALRGPALSRRGRAGAALRFRLTRPAGVRFEVVPVPGSDARPGPRTAAIPRFSARGRRGLNRFRFSGRIRGRALAPGAYRLLVSAVDRAGRRSPTRTADFKIRRRGPH
jgi:hypothetical protein